MRLGFGAELPPADVVALFECLREMAHDGAFRKAAVGGDLGSAKRGNFASKNFDVFSC